jgi:GNAT superfamily N-acetyltransferase
VIEELIDQGLVLVATVGREIVGCLQLLDPDTEGEIELAILAVAEEHQGRGIGSVLVERAIAEARSRGLRTMRVGTSSVDISNPPHAKSPALVEALAIERDAFTPADGYPIRSHFNTQATHTNTSRPNIHTTSRPSTHTGRSIGQLEHEIPG